MSGPHAAGLNPHPVPYTDFRAGLPVRVKQALILLTQARPHAVLDVGCADSGLLAALPATSLKVGLDRAANRFRPPGVRFVQSDLVGHHLPFRSECFDAVFAGEVIEHLLDTARFLRDLHRVLKPTGMLVLTTPNLCSLRNLYHWLRRQQLAWVDYREGQWGHVRHFSPASLRLLLAETGFVVTRLGSSGFEVGGRLPSLAWLTGLTQRVFARSLRGNCLVVAATKTGHA